MLLQYKIRCWVIIVKAAYFTGSQFNYQYEKDTFGLLCQLHVYSHFWCLYIPLKFHYFWQILHKISFVFTVHDNNSGYIEPAPQMHSNMEYFMLSLTWNQGAVNANYLRSLRNSKFWRFDFWTKILRHKIWNGVITTHYLYWLHIWKFITNPSKTDSKERETPLYQPTQLYRSIYHQIINQL
jgi:hypothetical protein